MVVSDTRGEGAAVTSSDEGSGGEPRWCAVRGREGGEEEKEGMRKKKRRKKELGIYCWRRVKEKKEKREKVIKLL